MPGLALLRSAQGRTESARSLLERALSEPSLTQLDRAKLLPAQVEVAIEAGATDVARAAAEELTAIAATYGSPALVARAAYARGLVELSEGLAAPASGQPAARMAAVEGLRSPVRSRARARLARAGLSRVRERG